MTTSVRIASANAADDRPVSDLIVRERRLRTFEQLPRELPGYAASDNGPAILPMDAAVPHTVKRLAVRHSRRRVAREGPDLG